MKIRYANSRTHFQDLVPGDVFKFQCDGYGENPCLFLGDEKVFDLESCEFFEEDDPEVYVVLLEATLVIGNQK